MWGRDERDQNVLGTMMKKRGKGVKEEESKRRRKMRVYREVEVMKLE